MKGSLDPGWFAEWLERRGPWAFHVTHRGNADAINSRGLLPWNETSGGTSFSGSTTPRRGYVYLTAGRDACEHQWELSQVDPAVGAVACVDLRLIAADRLVPDEDPWSLNVADWTEHRWGLNPRAGDDIGEGALAYWWRVGRRRSPRSAAWSSRMGAERVGAVRGPRPHRRRCHHGWSLRCAWSLGTAFRSSARLTETASCLEPVAAARPADFPRG
jgi:hypothetical protein